MSSSEGLAPSALLTQQAATSATASWHKRFTVSSSGGTCPVRPIARAPRILFAVVPDRCVGVRDLPVVACGWILAAHCSLDARWPPMVLDLLDRFKWVLAGGAVGLVLWLFRRKYVHAGERLAFQLGALGRALAPLVLPMLVVAASAATYYGWIAQAVVGALIAALLWVLFWAESNLRKDRLGATIRLFKAMGQGP